MSDAANNIAKQNSCTFLKSLLQRKTQETETEIVPWIIAMRTVFSAYLIKFVTHSYTKTESFEVDQRKNIFLSSDV